MNNQLKQLKSIISDLLEITDKWDEIYNSILDSNHFKKDSLANWMKQSLIFKFISAFFSVLFLCNISYFIYKVNISDFSEMNVSETLKVVYFDEIRCIIYVFDYLIHSNENNHILGFTYIIIPYAIQIVIIILALCNIVISPKETSFNQSTSIEIATASTNNFLSFWPKLWLTWFFLYTLLLIQNLGDFDDTTNGYIFPVINFINNLSGLFLFSMFYEMHEKTVTTKHQDTRQIYYLALILLTLLISLEIILISHNPSDRSEISRNFSIISGLFVGIATGLLITKFSSILFKVPLYALMILIGYAVLQPVLPFVINIGRSTEMGRIAYISLGLVGKITFFAVIHWCRDSDKIFYYMLRAANLYHQENEENMKDRVLQIIAEMDKPESLDSKSKK